MSKRKRFGLSHNLEQGLKDVVNAAENHFASARYEVIALTRVEIDPDNPRNLAITPEEISKGISLADEQPKEKLEELEKLQGLAETIKSKGIINPVVVYKYAEKYRLVAGERRYLASLLAGKDDIQAKILSEKPKGVDLRLLQWIENTEREDLSLKDRIGNVKSIIDEYKKVNPNIATTATLLKTLINISLSQATAYIAVLNAPSDVADEIEAGKLNNLDKVAFIAKIDSPNIRKKAIKAVIEGLNLKQVKALMESETATIASVVKISSDVTKKRGRAATRVNMGTTTRPQVVKKLVQFVINQPGYNHLLDKFKDVNWMDFDQTAKAFKSLVTILEKESEK